MSSKTPSTDSWSSVLPFLGVGAFAGLFSSGLLGGLGKPMTRERLLQLHEEYASAVNKAIRLERIALELYTRQLEALKKLEPTNPVLDLESVEAFAVAKTALENANRLHERIEKGRGELVTQILDQHRSTRARSAAVRMLYVSLRWSEAVSPGLLDDLDEAGREVVIVGALAKRKVAKDPYASLNSVALCVEEVLRAGAVSDWGFFEEKLPRISASYIENYWPRERSVLRLDEALVRAVRPPWREGEYPEKEKPSAVSRQPSAESSADEPVAKDREDWRDALYVANRLLECLVDSHAKRAEPQHYDHAKQLAERLSSFVQSMMHDGVKFSDSMCTHIATTPRNQLRTEFRDVEHWCHVEDLINDLVGLKGSLWGVPYSAPLALDDLPPASEETRKAAGELLKEGLEIEPGKWYELSVSFPTLPNEGKLEIVHTDGTVQSMAVETVDWTKPAEVAEALVDLMGADNGAVFRPTEGQQMALAGAVETLMAEGLVFDQDVAVDMVAGEDGDIKARFGKYEGYARVDLLLNQIFDGPLEGSPGISDEE